MSNLNRLQKGDEDANQGSHAVTTALGSSSLVSPAPDSYPPQAATSASQPAPPAPIQTAAPAVPSKAEEPFVFIPDEYPEVDPAYISPDPSLPAASAALRSRYGQGDALSWIPEEIFREPSGSSVAEPDSVLGESGRFYHGYHEGKYYLPNDGVEQDRLDFQHEALKILLGGRLGLAPIANPKAVIDIATGTGIWAIEFARQHPGCRIIGTDLSAIQPGNAPPNVEFIKEDSEEEWLYDCKFDYVHLRAVCSCFDNPKTVMKHAFDNLKPGGWIEYLDGAFLAESMDGSINGTAIRRWGELVVQGAAAKGRNIQVTRYYKQWLADTGFVDVTEKKYPWVIGPWPRNPRLKLAGKYMAIQMKEHLRGAGFMMLTSLGLTTEQIDRLVLDARADLDNLLVHGFMPIWAVYARKPFDWEVKGTAAAHASQ